MLPKSKRLTTEDFKTLKGGRTTHTPHLILRLSPAPEGVGKFAVVVSSSNYKRAVDRNLLRRRLYSLIKRLLPLLPKGILTVTCKKGALLATFSELENEVHSLCAKKPTSTAV